MVLSVLTFALVLGLAFANGTNDVSKAIATLVGSGVTDYRKAILWGTLWTVAGSGLSAVMGQAMLNTFSSGLIQPGTVAGPAVALAVLMGAMTWVLFASATGLPVSTTHALTGAIVGAGMVALTVEGLVWTAIVKKIVLPLLLSPVLAMTVSVTFHPALRVLALRWQPAESGTHSPSLSSVGALRGAPHNLQLAIPKRALVGVDSIHWISSGLASLARGANDTPKIVAMLFLGSISTSGHSAPFQFIAFSAVALAIGLGSYWGGLRVTAVLAEKVTRMDHVEGLSANLTTSSLVMVSATLGLPVSTTHVSSSAIIGIGILKGLKNVQWKTVRDMVLAWIMTLPGAALLAAITYFICNAIL